MDILKYRQVPEGGRPHIEGVVRLYVVGATCMVTESESKHALSSDTAIQRFYCITKPKNEETVLEARIAGASTFRAPLITLYQAFGGLQLAPADVVEEGLRICLARIAAREVEDKLEKENKAKNKELLADLRAIAKATSGGVLRSPVMLQKGEPLFLRLVGPAHPPATIVVFGLAREPVR